MLAGFDAYKNHIGFEIWTDMLRSEDRKMLEEKGYKTGSRTFHIKSDQKVPTTVIKKMLKAQAKMNEVKSKRNNPMTKRVISSGVVHKIPADLREALTSDPKALALWESLTPLARNEWICWVISVKKPETRKEHIERTRTELKEGMRRPCCWCGCIHRTDKPVSPSVQKVILDRQPKTKSLFAAKEQNQLG